MMEKQEQVFPDSLSFRLGRKLRQDLERYAKEDSRSVGNYIRLILEQHSAQREAEEAQGEAK